MPKQHVFDRAGPEESYAAMSNPSNGLYVESRFEDAISNQFIIERQRNGLNTVYYRMNILQRPNAHREIQERLNETFESGVQVSQVSEYASLYATKDVIIWVYDSSNSFRVTMRGDSDEIAMAKKMFNEYFDVVTSTIDWVTTINMDQVTIPMAAPSGIKDTNYPFIEEGVDAFVNSYLTSSENILLLIGEPGTGKSNFIKHIIAKSEQTATVTYDPKIMETDQFFSHFIDGSYGSLIMEDADAFLSERTEGNQFMSKFLNVGDGLVSMKNKKIIFSTNLENLDSVDPALVRPGRCFSVVQFRKLSYKETLAFLEDHGLTGTWEPESGESYSLAEIYNATGRQRQLKKRKVGFL